MRIAIAVTKKVLFRGVQQEFSNVYHYELLGAQTGPWESLLDEVRASETAFHSTDVTFVRGNVWSAGGTPAENTMLFQKVFTGTGNQAVNASLDRERAVLVQWPAGVDTRGKPVYLRKWFHSCGVCQGVLWSAAHLQNTAEISQAQRDTIATAAAAFDEVGSLEAWQLCSASGRRKSAPPATHRYLEHHQLGDAWR